MGSVLERETATNGVHMLKKLFLGNNGPISYEITAAWQVVRVQRLWKKEEVAKELHSIA